MLDVSLRQQVGPIGEAAHDAIDMVLGDGLENNPAKLIFQNLEPGARFNPMFAPEFGAGGPGCWEANGQVER